MRYIATATVGGMISSTVLTSIVIPAIYAAVEERLLSVDGGRRA
jgi:Cu/Ag efflux pump CusA